MSKNVSRRMIAAAAALVLCGLLLAVPIRFMDTTAPEEKAAAPPEEAAKRIVLVRPFLREKPKQAEAASPAPASPAATAAQAPVQEQAEVPEMPDSGPPPVANRQREVLPEPPAELPAAEPEPGGPAAVSSPYSAAADRDFSEKKPGSRAPAGGQLQVTVHQKENTITVPLFLPAMAVEPILPAYPRKAREKGIEGTVLIRLHVDAKGIPQSAEIAASSGSDLLDTSALKAVKAVKFLPAFEGEKPIASEVVVPIRFVLDDTQPE